MDEPSGSARKTGNIRRPPVQETADPTGRKPVAQWVISGSVARPADEVLPELARSAEVRPPATAAWPVRWILAGVAVGLLAAAPLALWLLR